MAKFVNDVFVGKGVATTTALDAQPIGSIVILNEKNEVINTAALGGAAKSIRIGYVSGPSKTILLPSGATKVINVARLSDVILRDEIFTPDVKVIPYSAARQQVTTVTFPTTLAANTRYAVRILLRDDQGTKTQITKSFDYITGATPPTATAMVAALAQRINRRLAVDTLVASAATNVLTLTGVPRIDNPGKNTLNLFSQNIFEVAGTARENSDYLSSPSSAGIVVATTVKADKGNGTFELVRDAERANLPYQGFANPLAFPVDAPDLTVDPTKTYDTLVIEYNKDYRSADNQYIKSTPKSVEVYGEAGTLATAATVLNAYINGYTAP